MSSTFQEKLFENPPECTEANPDYWFADPNDDDEKFGRSEQAIARTICLRCPLMSDCFKYAIDNEIVEGIWGASLPQQRIAYRNKVSLQIRQQEQKHGKR